MIHVCGLSRKSVVNCQQRPRCVSRAWYSAWPGAPHQPITTVPFLGPLSLQTSATFPEPSKDTIAGIITAAIVSLLTLLVSSFVLYRRKSRSRRRVRELRLETTTPRVLLEVGVRWSGSWRGVLCTLLIAVSHDRYSIPNHMCR